MSKYDISAKRLRSFDNVKDWFSTTSSPEELVLIGFFQNTYELIECRECHITWHKIILIEKKFVHKFSCGLIKEIEQKTERVKRKAERVKKAQKQKKIQLTEQKIQEQTQREIKLTECQIKWKAKKQVELIEQEIQKKVIEISKSTSISVNIGIFDSTLICDILKFGLYNKVMSFLKHLQQIQHQDLYCEFDVLDLLFKCLREFAFAWFNNQSSFIIIQKFDRDLTCAFSITSLEFIAKSSISISHSSLQYHSCVECFVQFFSLSRFLKHIKQENVCFKVVCKQCEQSFNFKNKFHDHIREQHINSNLKFFTSESTYKIKKKSTVVCSSASFVSLVSFVSSIFFATSTSIFESVSSKCSNLPITTLNITSKSMETLSASFFRTFVRKHQEFHIQKSYFIIDDLICMFREKFKSFDLRQHQKRRFSSQSIDARQFVTYQFRIIVYFLFAVNQKASISQSLKSSNPKSFQQHTSAKSIRSAFALREKSTFSSYKKSSIFYISLSSKSSFLQSKFSFAWFTSSFTSSSFFRSLISNHVCCICFDHFSFRNDLFNYSSSSQSNPSNRRSMREVREMISRFEAKLKKNER